MGRFRLLRVAAAEASIAFGLVSGGVPLSPRMAPAFEQRMADSELSRLWQTTRCEQAASRGSFNSAAVLAVLPSGEEADRPCEAAQASG